MSITREQVLSMSLAEIFVAIKDPKTSAEMQQLMRERPVAARISELMLEQKNREEEVDRQITLANPPTTETLAAEAAAVAAEGAPPAVVPPAETVPSAEAVPPVERKKIVREYQVRDEEGNPIGRPTHLEAWTTDEMYEKMQTAHENATRAFHRLKKQKLQFKEQEQNRILSPEEIKAAATKAFETKDAAEAEKVVRSIIDADFKEKETKLQQQRDFQEGVAIGNSFLRRHLHDFNPCEANQKALGDYLRVHGLDFTLDNIEAAFIDLTEQGDKLAPPVSGEAKRPVEAATNTPPTTVASPPVAPAELPPAPAAAATPPAVAQPTVVPETSQPAVVATATTPVVTPPNAATPTRRPGVNGSLAPGTMSANRPSAVDPAQARKEFMRELKVMSPEVMKKKLATDPQFVKQLNTYGIRIQ